MSARHEPQKSSRELGTLEYLYRAVDKAGGTLDFLLTTRRDRQAALRFLSKAIRHNATPETIMIDKSGANTAAIESLNTERKAGIEMCQVKYPNNIELIHMIRKGQLLLTGELRPAQQFHSLAE